MVPGITDYYSAQKTLNISARKENNDLGRTQYQISRNIHPCIVWQAGPAIPSPGLAYGCAVAIDATRFVVTGGKKFSPTAALDNVRMYDTTSLTWRQIWKTERCNLRKTTHNLNEQRAIFEFLLSTVLICNFFIFIYNLNVWHHLV